MLNELSKRKGKKKLRAVCQLMAKLAVIKLV